MKTLIVALITVGIVAYAVHGWLPIAADMNLSFGQFWRNIINHYSVKEPAAQSREPSQANYEGILMKNQAVHVLKKQYLKDPRSFEMINWKVMKSRTGYILRMKYRAKNSFGGYVIETKTFVFDGARTLVGIL